MSGKTIYYVLNLHESRTGSEVRPFSALSRARKWAEGRAAATGCTFAVTQFVEGIQGERRCPHMNPGDVRDARRKS